MWWGFGVNAFTGIGAVLRRRARRAPSTSDFWIKLVFVAVGVFALVRMRKSVRATPRSTTARCRPRPRRWPWVSLVCWFGAIVAGRLIAYVGPVAGV